MSPYAQLTHISPAMTGASKLCNITSIYAHKSYKLLNNASSSTASGVVNPRKFTRLRYSAGRWWRLTPWAPAGLNSLVLNNRNCGANFLPCMSDSMGKGNNCRFNRRPSDNFAIGDGKVHAQSIKSDVSPPGGKPPKLLTLPTILTIGRVFAVPLLVSTFYVDSWWGPAVTTGIFVAASITDWLDGYLARKMNLGTQFGAFLDPVADKLMVAATLIMLCTRPVEVGMLGQASWLYTLPAIVIIGREITMSAVREWAASQDKKLLQAVAVNNLGKWKTATQMTSLTILLAVRDGSLMGAGILAPTGVVLLYVSAWLSLWSLTVYMRKIWKVLLL